MIAKLANWKKEPEKIVKHYQFKDFVEAFAFLQKVATLAEKHNHHPHIINVYNRVTLELTTHDSMALTAKDYDLAAAIDAL
ncbi:MAG: 4a-hydroxytetrahydrobiopterin dehydratase [Pseudomonadota bacterium]|nr:4a-hydroxytetrahydrobiopterin dehydratase [Pseudomonadota bacterium]